MTIPADHLIILKWIVLWVFAGFMVGSLAGVFCLIYRFHKRPKESKHSIDGYYRPWSVTTGKAVYHEPESVDGSKANFNSD